MPKKTNIQIAEKGDNKTKETQASDRKITKEAVIAKIVRVITVAPFMAALMLTVIWFTRPDSYLGFGHYLYALCVLTVFPLLSYPVSAIIPALRKKGRDGQRNLAIVFSVVDISPAFSGRCFSAPGGSSCSYL